MSARLSLVSAAALLAGVTIACGGHPPPTAHPTAPASVPPTAAPATPTETGTAPTSTTVPPPPPTPTISSDPISGDPYVTESPDAINQHSPLQPVFFALDSDQLDDLAKKAIEDDAQVLKKYASWVITIEGHCDERGTAEYNLALGERRALAVKGYLQTLGLSADRFRTVSYGKEFPFDPGHAESSWAKNRRAHLMVTSK